MRVNYESRRFDKNKRILFVSPKNPRGAFISTSFLRSIKELYGDFNIYVACEPTNNSFFEGNKYIHKIIPYSGEMQDPNWLRGLVGQTDHFNIVFSSNNFDLENFAMFSKEETKIPYSNLKYAHS